MKKKEYTVPSIEIHDTNASMPLAGSLLNPGGQVNDFTWEEGEGNEGDNNNPGGSIDDFVWE